MTSNIILQEKFEKAAELGDLDAVRLLLSSVNPKNESCRALREAASSGHIDVVRFLIPHSDDPTGRNIALRFAAGSGQANIVSLLLPISTPKADRSLALQCAAEQGHVEIVKALIPVSDVEIDDFRALRCAAVNGQTEAMRLLIPLSDVNIAFHTCIEDKKWRGCDTLSPHVSRLLVDVALAAAPPEEMPQARARLSAENLKIALTSDAAPQLSTRSTPRARL